MSEIIKTYEEKMIKSCDTLAADYVTIRAGRANPHILDKLKVDYYGTPTPFQQVANVSVPEARMIQIQPWETSLLKEIEKAILTSDLGLTPTNDVKDIKKKGENTKVAIRNIRRDANDAIKKLSKDTDMSEDEVKKNEDSIQKLTDKYVAQVDKMIDEKSKEIMTV